MMDFKFSFINPLIVIVYILYCHFTSSDILRYHQKWAWSFNMLLYDNYSAKLLPSAHVSLHYTEENGYKK